MDLLDFVCASPFITGEGKLIPTEFQSPLPSGIYRISLEVFTESAVGTKQTYWLL